jgi:hypothetical protein
MAKHLFSALDKQIHSEIFEPERLKTKIPRMADIYEGATKLKEIHNEINNVGKFQRANGFLGDRSMQRVAHMDIDHWLAAEKLHQATCDCGGELGGRNGHKAWFYEWLKQDGPNALDVRGKIIV